ncbi:MAG: RnfABCDGE type electron transport complex subunit B [Lachnospiraceae bacterium]|nr:RnfABCDGE type electron transport complex subunit B [Lachnospiraceae bacterium]
MGPVLIAVGILGAIALVCGLLLAFASKYMSVPVDESFAKIRACLPGANCGGCGYPGCDGYANALADGSEEKVSKCTAGGNAVAEALAEACGRSFEAVERKTAYVRCKGDCAVTSKNTDYQGMKTCKAVRLLYGGDGACQYGCIGAGDCAAVCPEQAINVVNGVARVNADRCIGCGQCAGACPQKIISMIPSETFVKVTCSNRDKGAVTRKKCTAGCIGCGLCVRKCPQNAIKLEQNLAVIDDSLCAGCGLCRDACPQKCIL